MGRMPTNKKPPYSISYYRKEVCPMELYFKRNSMMLIGKPAELRSYLDEVCRKYNTLNDLIKAHLN